MTRLLSTLILLLALSALLVLPTTCAAAVADPHPSASLPTYYELLESAPTASDKDLKKAYRRLALSTHPDKSTTASDRTTREQQFIQLSQAYEILSNPDLRPRYDYLLTQHIHVYDDRIRDWSTFEPSTGQFSRPSKATVSFGDGRFSFTSGSSYSAGDARQRWEAEQAEEAREKRALLLALIGSLSVAVTPVGWYYYQLMRARYAEKRRKAEANVKLREGQQALTEMQQERAEEERRRKDEMRQRAAELRRQRAEAELAEEEDGDEDDQDAENNGTQLGAEGMSGGAVDQPNVPAADIGEQDEEEDARPKKGGGGSLHSCDLCRKKF